MDYSNFFKDNIRNLKEDGRYRVFTNIRRIRGKFPICQYTGDNLNVPKEITIWCSNDYMAMGQNESVIKAMKDAIDDAGTGAGGTRNISGTTSYHTELENTLKNWFNKESALVFTSGWVANLTILSTLGERLPGCIIYSDSMNHNSMIEGVRRSRCEKRIFRHNDPADLERLISQDDPNVPKIIAFESVYSMDGDIAPIKEIVAIAKEYNAIIYLDEVHAIGMYGENGSGVAEQLGITDEIDIIQGTLGKAIGQVGGFMVANKDLVDFVRSFGNGFIFTTSLPPAVMASASTSIKHLIGAKQERTHLHNIAAQLKEDFKAKGLPVMNSTSHIVPVVIGDAEKCKTISDTMLTKYGIYVQPINYPTVAKGTERLRFSPSPAHTSEMVKKATNALEEIMKTY